MGKTFGQFVVARVFKYVNNKVINKIKDTDLKKGFTDLLLNPSQKALDALVDRDPNNNQQMKAIWDEYKASLALNSIPMVKALAEKKLKDSEERDMLFDILNRLNQQEETKIEDTILTNKR